MKKMLLAAVLPLALMAGACATVAEGVSNAALVAGVEASEAATRARCPDGAVQLIMLSAARGAFDARYRARLSPADLGRVDEARRLTDIVCGIVSAPADG